MQIGLFVVVEKDGATFRFGSADGSMAELAAYAQRKADEARAQIAAAGSDAEFGDAVEAALIADTDDSDALAIMCRYFVEAVRGWDGVTDETAQVLRFTPEAVREFPTELKAELAALALAKRAEGMQKKGQPDEQPTISTQ